MKAAVINQHITDFNQIDFKEVNVPQLRPGTALVKVVAASINPVDKLITFGYTGGMGWVVPFPYIPGEDYAGVVHAVADDVANVKVGDEVFVSNWGQGRHDDLVENPVVGGAFAEYALVIASKLSHKPASLSFEDAAGIGIVGTTAYEGVVKIGQVKASDKVLIFGGSSAVGIYSVQIAKILGAYVVATASSKNADFVRSLGADKVITYDTTNWENEADVKNFDLVYDCIGESEGLVRAVKAGTVRSDGKYVSIANFALGLDPNGHPPLSFGAAICFKQDPTAQSEIAQWIVEGKVKPYIDEVYSFDADGIQNIFNKIASGRSVGKNILKVNI